MRQVLAWVAQGRLKARVQATYPLERIRDALGVLERRQAVGKIVLTL
jgi:NADPH2:quinone reductase